MPEMNDQQIFELAENKMTSEDSGWMTVYLLIQMKTMLKDIATDINGVHFAIAGKHDNKSEYPVKELLARNLVTLRMIRFLIEDHTGDKRPSEDALMKKRGWRR